MNIITTPIANNPLTIASFLAGATLSSILIGWLVKTGSLPLKNMMAYSEGQLRFMRVWVKIALVIGVIVPLVLLITLWSNKNARQFLASYLVVVVVQLACEASFSRWLVKSVVVVIGTIYTIFRLWQVWEGLHLTSYTQLQLGLLWLVMLFWIANIIMLIFMAIPTILPEKNENQPSN
ncbi:hypothetical protein NIES4071_26410 [Calothrix sp. NIES-4071]|nr:hypothetical protein NIES4071_26410 [Calothrix sp. NIES-4071]BAZ56963.1 hypothetical protein NIES4105_26350 [Calothrix sp. NIES-4105]